MSIVWKKVSDELPDDDVTVLIALADGDVFTGFLDAGDWRYVSADLIDVPVTHWANFPYPPAA